MYRYRRRAASVNLKTEKEQLLTGEMSGLNFSSRISNIEPLEMNVLVLKYISPEV